MTLSGYQYNASGGETFDSIARDVYGDEKYAADLMCANPEYCRKIVMTGGEIILLPLVTFPPEDRGALPETAPWKED